MAEIEIDHSLVWPERPTCHDRDGHAQRYSALDSGWRPPRLRRDESDPYEETWRTCWYCGSMHPEDLYRILKGQPVVERQEFDVSKAVEEFGPDGYHKALAEHYRREEAKGVRLGGADWKYGWPHKFYVDGIPNPAAGEEFVTYTMRGAIDDLPPEEQQEWEARPDASPGYRKVYSRSQASPTQRGKWYNEHFYDLEHERTFEVFAKLIESHSGILFSRGDDGRLLYRAPYRGYQA